MGFVRAFGLHRPDRTPCGRPLSVSEAYALHELAGESWLAQQELARRLGLEKSTVSRLVAGLVDRGWANREPEPGNRRATRLCLTAAGSRVAQEVAAARRRRFESLLSALPEQQAAAVVDSLTLLRKVLDDQDPAPIDQ